MNIVLWILQALLALAFLGLVFNLVLLVLAAVVAYGRFVIVPF